MCSGYHHTKHAGSSLSLQYIDKEERYGAHNYAPIPVVLAKAEGVHMWDVDGKRYYDFLSAYSAVNQGHQHPRVSTLQYQSSAFGTVLGANSPLHKHIPMGSLKACQQAPGCQTEGPAVTERAQHTREFSMALYMLACLVPVQPAPSRSTGCQQGAPDMGFPFRGVSTTVFSARAVTVGLGVRWCSATFASAHYEVVQVLPSPAIASFKPPSSPITTCCAHRLEAIVQEAHCEALTTGH